MMPVLRTVLTPCATALVLSLRIKLRISDSHQSNHWFAGFVKRKSLCVKTVCVRKYFTMLQKDKARSQRMFL